MSTADLIAMDMKLTSCLDRLDRLERKIDLIFHVLEKQNVRAKSDFCPVYGCMTRTESGTLCDEHRPECIL